MKKIRNAVVGTPEDDRINLPDNGATVYTYGGDDVVWDGLGDDFIFTGAGHDIVYATGGIDQVNLGAGDDMIYIQNPGHPNEIFQGGKGFDTAYVFIEDGATATLLNLQGFERVFVYEA